MNRHSVRLVVIVVVAAFAGGAASHWLLSPQGTGPRAARGAKGKPTATGSKIVVATAFKVVDAKGKERVRFATNKEGMGALVIFGKSGKPRIALNVNGKDQPVVGLYNAAGKPQLTIALSVADEPGIALMGDAGKPGSVYTVSAKGSTITMADSQGKPRATMGYSNKTDVASLRFANAEGKVIWSAPQTTGK